RLPVHDRAAGRLIYLAPGLVALRPLLRPAGALGALDVRAVEGGTEGPAAQPPDRDHAVHDAGDDDVHLPAALVRAESLLPGVQPLQHSAAVADRKAPAGGAGETRREYVTRGR